MADNKENYSCYFGSKRVNKMVSMSPNMSDILIIQLKMTEVCSKLREKLFCR